MIAKRTVLPRRKPCRSRNELKSSFLAVARVASSWRGTWRDRGDRRPSWNDDGLVAPVERFREAHPKDYMDCSGSGVLFASIAR
jgi:hypothetical protein